MRIEIELDDPLVEEARRLTGIESMDDLVHEGLRRLIAAHKRRSLFELSGQIEFAEDFDHKPLREGRD